MVAPAILSGVDTAVYAYVLMIVAGAMFLLRAIQTDKMYVSLYHLALMVLLGYSLISSFWVTNRSMHFVYLSVITSAIFLLSLTVDYFTETSEEKSQRRMLYMMSVGSILCALVNVVYWLTEIVPYGKTESLSQGMGTNHYLAVYMLMGIVVTAKLIKGNSKLRQVMFVIGIVTMLFVFIMCKSFYSWLLIASFLVIYFFGKKSEGRFFAVSILTVSAFTAVLITVFFSSAESAVFKDVFSYGNFFGRGGGFLSACELFTAESPQNVKMPGLLSTLYASSGVLGLLCALVFVFKPVMHFIKLRTWTSVLNLILTVMLMLLSFGDNLTVIVLWIGIIAYNEKMGDYAIKRQLNLKADDVKKVSVVFVSIGLITVIFISQRFMVLGAKKQFEKENYMEAYSLYNAAASINLFDSESACGAAQSLLESSNPAGHYEQAVGLSEKAQKRDKSSICAQKTEAQLHFAAGRYDLAIETYTEISSRAKVNYEYNLLLAESLYKIVENNPEGSAETIAAYEKIIEIAKKTDNLDYREKINNIGDKALVYKRRRTEIEQ